MVRRTGWALGAEVSILALHARRGTAERAAAAAFAELERIERAMSLYRADSQLVALNRDGSLERPDGLLLEALRASADLSQRTDGAFDVTVQPLWEVYWRASRLPWAPPGGAASSLPEEGAVEAARRLVNWRDVEVSASRVRLARKGMGVTLNGIAQGLAADRVLAVLREHGIEHAMVNTGEIGSMGRQEGGGPWTVGVQHPREADAHIAVAALDGRCLATSGDYQTRFGEGFGQHHIFDPATGRSPTAFSSVTVLAPRGLDADALSTAVFVLGPQKGLQLVKSTPGADALLVFKDCRTLATEGFPEVRS